MMARKDAGFSPIPAVGIVVGLCLIGDSMLYITLPVFWEDAGLSSLVQVGILLSINRFIRIPLNPVIGWFYSRFSLGSGLIIAVIITGAATVGYGISQSFWFFFFCRILWGLAWSFLNIGGYMTVIRYSSDHDRGKQIGTYNGIYRLGSLAGMLVGGAMVYLVGFSYVSILFGLISLTGILIILTSIDVFKGDDQHNKKMFPHSKADVMKLLFSRRIIVIIVTALFISLLYEGVLTSTLSHMIQWKYGDHIHLFGIVIASATLSGILQSLRWVWEPFVGRAIGSHSDRQGDRIHLFLIVLFITSILLLVFPVHLKIEYWMMIALLLLLTATANKTLIDAICTDAARSNTAAVISIYTLSMDLGAALGPFLSYMIIDLSYGYVALFYGASMICIFLMLIWWMESKRNRKAARSSI